MIPTKPPIPEHMQKYFAKKKYYDKVLSPNAMWNVYLRTIDVEPLMPYYLWTNIYPFDLAQLGIGLIFSITGINFDALKLGFTWSTPTWTELSWGILIKFEPIDWTIFFPELGDFDLFLDLNFLEEFIPQTLKKAYYGKSKYDESFYDPSHFIEMITSTIWRLRQMNPSDPLYRQTIMELAELLGIQEATLTFITDKVNMILAAQEQTFILGLGILDISILQEPEDGYVKFTFTDHAGKTHEVYIKNLSDLLYGLILDVTPLGYGILLPEEDIHRLDEETGDIRFLSFLYTKNETIRNTLPLLPFSFSNYQTFNEMANVHANQRVSQYDALNHLRNLLENWVAMNIPLEEANPMTIRQYQNAILQYFGWLTKRHTWGMDIYKQMSEEEYKNFWIKYWVAQGLRESTLNKLYDGMELWKKAILREKQNLGKLIQQTRKALSLPP